MKREDARQAQRDHNRSKMVSLRTIAVRRLNYQQYGSLREVVTTLGPLRSKLAHLRDLPDHPDLEPVVLEGESVMSRFADLREALLVSEAHRLVDLCHRYSRISGLRVTIRAATIHEFLEELARLLEPLKLPSLLDVMAVEIKRAEEETREST